MSIIIFKIAALLGVIAIGSALKSFRLLPTPTLAPLNKIIIDIFLPAMIFSRLLATTTWPTIAENFYLPLVAALLFGGSLFISLLLARQFARPSRIRSTMFLAATANWIYLPYPVMEALYGETGEQIVLLLNVGALCTIWTLGLGLLTSGHSIKTGAFTILRAPGVWATVSALLLICFSSDSPASLQNSSLFSVFLEITGYLGQLTIPLSLLVMGANLAEQFNLKNLLYRDSILASAVRLIVIPWIAFSIIRIFESYGFVMPEPSKVTVLLISCMPTAVNAGMLVERYTSDKKLGCDTVLLTSLAVLITLPINMWFFSWL